MLPASFQTPASILFVLGGLLSCFAGYRYFRIVLGLFGFVVGALLASSVMGTEQTTWMIGAALIGGLTGALILIAAYFVGVALIGAGFGAAAANLIWAGLGSEPHLVMVIVSSILGAVVALWLQRYVIIVATAFGGAWTTIVGVLAMMGDRVAENAAAKSDVWLVYPMNPAPGQRWVIFVWLALGIAGVIGQLTFTADKKRR
jgi:Domain of unknown function (DUF4203)